MSLIKAASQRIFSTIPTDLIHFSPLPGHFIRKAPYNEHEVFKDYNRVHLNSKGLRIIVADGKLRVLALNECIREFQIQLSYDSRNDPKEPDQVVRLYDWLTEDNPLLSRHLEIHKGWKPDKTGNSYGWKYTWETIRTVRVPKYIPYVVPESKSVRKHLAYSQVTEGA
ncbi:MAG: hypothetical protein Q9170_003405 [Blastenia crenularia]